MTNGATGSRPRFTARTFPRISPRSPPRWIVPVSASPGARHGIGPSRAQSTLHTPGPKRNRSIARRYAAGSRSPAIRTKAGGTTSRRTAPARGSSVSEPTHRPDSTSPPSRRSSPTSASVRRCAPPSTTGQPTACAAAPSTRPKAALAGDSRGAIPWAASAPNSARAGASRKASVARAAAGSSAAGPNRAAETGWRGSRGTGPIAQGMTRSTSRATGATSARQAGPSRPSPAAVSSTSRWSSTARSGASRCAAGTAAWARRTSSGPDAAPAPRARKKGEMSAVATTVAHGSWTNPGSVRAADRRPPPGTAAPSMTRTATPARASVIAAASPFGPLPTTIACGKDFDTC